MKTYKLAALLFTGGLLAPLAFAENASAAPTASPTPSAPAPNQIIYLPQLPGVPELTRAATAQSMTIKQIVQLPGDLTITYQLADGQTKIVAYRQLADAGNGNTSVATPSPAPTGREWRGEGQLRNPFAHVDRRNEKWRSIPR